VLTSISFSALSLINLKNRSFSVNVNCDVEISSLPAKTAVVKIFNWYVTKNRERDEKKDP
jgi:hypothetical protein